MTDPHLRPTVIEPGSSWGLPDIGDLWRSRDLLMIFVRRDIKVRYRETAFGAGWAVLQPLLTMAMMTLLFRRLIGVPSEGIPYPLFCLSGVILWTYLAQSVTGSASSIIGNAPLVEKVFFPRLLMPMANALAGLLDLAVSFVLLLTLMILYGRSPSPLALLCIPVALLAALLAIGMGAGLAALMVRFRDLGYVIPFATQLMLFLTPVAYPASLVPSEWRLLLGVNPAAGFIELFRWLLLGTQSNPWPLFAVSICSSLIIFAGGLLVFHRLEPGFADVI